MIGESNMKLFDKISFSSILLVAFLIIHLSLEVNLILPAHALYDSIEERYDMSTSQHKISFNRLKDILKNLNTLEEYINSFYPDKNQKEKNLIVLRLIRELRTSYDNLYWHTIAGQCDSDIKNMIKYGTKIGDALNFFEDLRPGENLIDPHTLDNIDFKHLVAALNVIINSKNYNLFCDLAGWAGDLHSCIGDMQSQYYNSKHMKDEDFNNYAIKIIGNGLYHFPTEDILADIDAYNIAEKMKSEPDKPFSLILSDYYLNFANERFLLFINNYSFTEQNNGQKKLLQERVKELTNLEYINLPPRNDVLQKYKIRDYIQSELTALGNAFLSYIRQQAIKELQIPDNIEILATGNNSIKVCFENNSNPTGTLYQLAVFNGKDKIVWQSKWTTALTENIHDLVPFTPYSVKIKVKTLGLDDVETDWYLLNKISIGLQQAGSLISPSTYVLSSLDDKLNIDYSRYNFLMLHPIHSY